MYLQPVEFRAVEGQDPKTGCEIFFQFLTSEKKKKKQNYLSQMSSVVLFWPWFWFYFDGS